VSAAASSADQLIKPGLVRTAEFKGPARHQNHSISSKPLNAGRMVAARIHGLLVCITATTTIIIVIIIIINNNTASSYSPYRPRPANGQFTGKDGIIF
jgi:hypothetical protein